jgi:hypothetical protein
MEHLVNEEELLITSKLDFIVPLKQLGVITRAVLECINLFYRPKRIIVIAPSKEKEVFHIVVPYWDVGRIEFITDEVFFSEKLGVKLETVLQEYDSNREGDQREPGWWIQQLIKLGASQIDDITENYVVWDGKTDFFFKFLFSFFFLLGDLIATRRWKICELSADKQSTDFYIAILQGKAKSEFNTTQYALSMKYLTGFDPLEPSYSPLSPSITQGTFVAHHMVFNKQFTKELLSLIAENSDFNRPWPLTIMSSSRKFYRFSEYKTYSSYMLRNHSSSFHYHDFSLFGDGGLRFRKAIPIIDDILSHYSFTNGGFSYQQIKHYVKNNWERLSTTSNNPNRVFPAYIQLDHVYGLDPNNLNIFISCSSSQSGSTSIDPSVTSITQDETDELKRFLSSDEEDVEGYDHCLRGSVSASTHSSVVRDSF